MKLPKKGGSVSLGKKAISSIRLRPKNEPPTVLLYGESCTGKTTLITSLAKRGVHLHYLDLDGNISPFQDLTEEALQNVSYIKVRDSASRLNIPLFLEELGTTGVAKVCVEHGHMLCNPCKQEGEFLRFSINDYGKEDVLVIDSMSTALDSILLQAKRDFPSDEATGSQDNVKASYNHWGAMATRTQNVLQILKSWRGPSILITHELDINSDLDGNKPEKIYPNLGTKKFSKNHMYPFDSVLYKTTKGLLTKRSSKYFAVVRRVLTSVNPEDILYECLNLNADG
jgi:hypothetical protein